MKKAGKPNNIGLTYKYCKFFSWPRGTNTPDNAAFPRSLHEGIIN